MQSGGIFSVICAMFSRFITVLLLLSSLIVEGQPNFKDSLRLMLKDYTTKSELNTLAYNYLLTKNCDEAILLYQQIINDYDTLSQAQIYKGYLYNHLGVSYFCANDFENALTNFNKGLSIREEFSDTLGVANSYSNIGLVYGKLLEYKKALKYHEKSLDIFYDISLHAGIANEFNNIGELHYKLKQYDNAEKYFLQSIEIFDSLNDIEGLLDNHRDMVNNYFAQKKYKKSHEHYQKMTIVSEILVKSNAKTFAEAKSRYNTEKKQQENKLLKKEIEVRKYRQYGLVSFLILILILIILFFFNYKKKKREEREKLLIELKLIKAEAIIKNISPSAQTRESEINQKAINEYTNQKLNETDWKILIIIYTNPTIINSEIADTVHLSIQGVKSSLKKMYSLFDLESGGNKKLALVIKITQIIQKEF